MFLHAIVMWTKFKNKLLKPKTTPTPPTKTGSPSGAKEWEDVLGPEPGSNKGERSTRSTPERNRRTTIRNRWPFFGKFSPKKEEVRTGSKIADRKYDVTAPGDKLVGNTSSTTLSPKVGTKSNRSLTKGSERERRIKTGSGKTSTDVEQFEMIPKESKNSPDRIPGRPSFTDYPVWIHRVWNDEDNEDEELRTSGSTPSTADPHPMNGVSTFLERSNHDPLTANCASKVSPPRLKRRKKPAPQINEPDSRKSRLGEVTGAVEGQESCFQTSESSSFHINRVSPPSVGTVVKMVDPPGVPYGGQGTSTSDEFSVSLERTRDQMDSIESGNGYNKEEDALPVLEDEDLFHWGVATRSLPLEKLDMASLAVTGNEENSPDFASDDAEGKESGYVTLEDLQAQLARSSWSSDDRDSGPETGRDRNRNRTLFRVTEPATSTSRSLNTGPTARESISGSFHCATWSSSVGDERMTSADSGDVTTSSDLKFTFTVKLESQMFRRRTGQAGIIGKRSETDEAGGHELVFYPSEPGHEDHPLTAHVEGTFGFAVGDQHHDLAPPQNDQDLVVNKSPANTKGGRRFVGSSSPLRNTFPVDSSAMPFQCSSCGQAINDDLLVAKNLEDNDESVVMTTRSSLATAGRHDSASLATSNAQKLNRKFTGKLPLAELQDNRTFQPIDVGRTEPEMDYEGEFPVAEDGSYMRPLLEKHGADDVTDANKSAVCMTCKMAEAVKCEKLLESASDELTHMNWSEVLEEARTLGIPLHPPNITLSMMDSDRSSKSSSMSSMTRREFDSSSLNIEELSVKVKVGDAGTSKSRLRSSSSTQRKTNKKASTRTGSNFIRDVFRIQNIFSKSDKENRKQHRRPEIDGGTVSRGRSTSSRECPQSPRESGFSSIQSWRLPPPPPSLDEDGDGELMIRSCPSRSCTCTRFESSSPCSHAQSISTGRTSGSGRVSRSASTASRSRDYYLDEFVGRSGRGGHRVGTEGEEGRARGSHQMRISPSISSIGSVFSQSSRGSSVAQGTPLTSASPSDRHQGSNTGLFSSVGRRKQNEDFGTSLEQLQNCSWYWGALSFEEAEEKLTSRADGTFLVRDSSDERYLLSLSFRSIGSTHHTRIEHYKGMFGFYSQPLTSHPNAATIVDFIDDAMMTSREGHCLYYLRPRGPGQPPAPVRLLYPLSRFPCMRSLQHLCKSTVLRHVRLDLVDRLPVAPRLKEYLKKSHPNNHV